MKAHKIITRKRDVYDRLVELEMKGSTSIINKKGMGHIIKNLGDNISLKIVGNIIHMKKKNSNFRINVYKK